MGRPRLYPENKSEEINAKQEVLNQSSESTSSTSSNSSSDSIVIVSELDAYVRERLKEQPKTHEEIEIKDRKIEGQASHILSLPKELESYAKEYGFRWINKKKRAIDNAIDVIGWNLVTRVFFPKLPKHLFTASGVIERGDAILGFMSKKRAETIRLKPAEISRERVKTTPVQDLRKWEDRGEQYYKPSLAAAEDDKESVAGMSVVPDEVNNNN